jgi:hypothetical protein
MNKVERQTAITKFQTIPSIGSKLAAIFVDELGFKKIAELKNKIPEDLFLKLSALRNEKQCRCVLYTFRCAIAFAQKPHQKNWWEFKS